ncbi:hypothetical protein F5Y06DRAFT_300332 [Hypoxylon sp. FL0890]|nr:hypothetical protein F5Y06DRAFT_300332 [Hypoxylon sp. FL0890]
MYSLLLFVLAFGYSVSAQWTVVPTTGVQLATTGQSAKPTSIAGTPAPDHEGVLRLLKNEEAEWVNAKTCGWYAGVSSQPFSCGDGGVCATNEAHIVACVTGTVSPFYSLCLDYSALQESSCDDGNTETGCCVNAQYPECATHIWTEAPQRSMYRCWSSAAIITMLDVPQFVADAARPTTSAEATIITDGGTNSNPLDPGSIHPGSDLPAPPAPGLPIGVIAGSTIGGSVFFILLFCSIRRYRRQRRLGEEARSRFEIRFDRGSEDESIIDPSIVEHEFPDGRTVVPRRSDPHVLQARRSMPNPPSSEHLQPGQYTTFVRIRPPPGTAAGNGGDRNGSDSPRRQENVVLGILEPHRVAGRSSTPPPRYSFMNPYPDATPTSVNTAVTDDHSSDWMTVTSPARTADFK